MKMGPTRLAISATRYTQKDVRDVNFRVSERTALKKADMMIMLFLG